ncbi:hypothetical protein E8E12_001011 [Didymella heteroderae]|uniref:Uncharacterized protein n=1 Tax=Didymella heteroderae TaxID=1769908 RepID=A0A9P4WLI6_9PLEO|nr:hypothetical protein E8E12_001011 [Didymella heteroderae]
MNGSKHTPRSSQSSNWRARAPSATEAALDASAPSFIPPLTQAQLVEALLAPGPIHVYIASEREDTGASPDQPVFLKGVRFDPAHSRTWYEEVLPYLSKCTFVFATTIDVTYGGSILGSAALPHIYNAVIKVELPKIYWLDGVALNRNHNPYLQMCRNLPNLRELGLTMHTAGLTNQRWAERQVIALERNNLEAAKERIVISLQEAVHRYELDALFACGGLRQLRVEYIESAMTAHLCKFGDPVDILQSVKTYLEHAFAQRQLQVIVELTKADVPV